MNLECISRKCIKPSSPTPPNLEIFNMSLLDQLSPNIHGNMTFFYPHKTCAQEFSAKSQLLQDSLSQILTLLYPLAGRLRDAATIHCNDQGAFFIQSRTQTPLSQILSPPNFDIIQNLLPTTDSETMQLSNSSLLLVRFTLFGCGATAITISLTHKIADFAAFITLLKAWTAACIGGDTQPVVPELGIGSALFPPREILPAGISGTVNIAAEKFTTRRLIFESSKVEELKKRVKSEGGVTLQFEPSRVEVVLGLIWRCALLSSKSKTPSALFQAVNLRPRMEPPIPETALGNFVWAFAVTVEEEYCEVELHVVVKKMRDSLKEFTESKVERLNNSEGRCEVVMEALKERGEMLKKKNGRVVYKCSSWCKVAGSSLYEVDFGWGKPLWMCSVNNIVSNTVALMDTWDGHGVEAFVTLDQQHMDSFQHSQELLHYALLNPPLL